MYREQLLEKALQTLVAPGGKSDDGKDPTRRARTEDVLTYVQTIMENSLSESASAKYVNSPSEFLFLKLYV